MYLSEITVKNFRLLTNTTVKLLEKNTLIIGRNNCGKTSFLVVVDKFFNSHKFSYNDFPLQVRGRLLSVINSPNTLNNLNSDLNIEMILKINIFESDNISQVADFILDLTGDYDSIEIMFRAKLNESKLVKDISGFESNSDKERFIKKNIGSYVDVEVFAYDNVKCLEVKRDINSVLSIINFQYVHARRDVASAEGTTQILSKITTEYFNKNNEEHQDFNDINNIMLEMDRKLEDRYDKFYDSFLKTSKD
ncbi:AAA family ATPase [Yersinia rohdei]|uniref:AAA family ATPase n=1 Tax=Yersinia rohdei TaxID=29485 RepID=UPI001643E158|nr:AAA family ATPase [Yersinia rohdei]